MPLSSPSFYSRSPALTQLKAHRLTEVEQRWMKRALRAPAAAVAQGTRPGPGNSPRARHKPSRGHPHLPSTDHHDPPPARAIPLSRLPSLPCRSVSQQQEAVLSARPCFPGGSGEGSPACAPRQVLNGTPQRWQRSALISPSLGLPAGRALLLQNLLARCWRLYKLLLTRQA